MRSQRGFFRCALRPALIAAALAALFVASPALYAQSSGSADPFTLWDHAANPAAWGFFPDAMAFGIQAEATASDLGSYEGGDFPGALRLAYGIPGLLYKYGNEQGSSSHSLTVAAPMGRLASFGWRLRRDSSLSYSPAWGVQDLGLLVRPLPYMSLALSWEDVLDAAGDGAGDFGLGVSIRPLAFDPALGSLLSLSADFMIGPDGLRASSAGARVAVGRWASAYGRYGFEDGSIGVGAAIALSGAETSLTASVPDSGFPEAVASVGQAFRVGRGTPDAGRAFGGAVLVIEDPGVYAPAPPLVEIDSGIVDGDLWFGQAVAAIDRAAKDPTIKALAMVGPPQFDTEGRAQEFGAALERFKKSGKKVYAFAASVDRLQYAYAVAQADYFALDPNGILPLVDVASFSPYFGGLLRRWGIDTYSLRSHPTKTANNIFTEDEITEAERAMKERYVDGLAAQGYAAIEAGRGSKLKGGAADAVASGPYLDPRDALAAGLVDALSYEDEFDAKLDELTGKAARISLARYAREPDGTWGGPIGKRVAVVHLVGSIIDDEGVAGASIGESAVELLEALAKDPMTAGVILRVDSGGGSAKTSDHIARAVQRLREAGKPVVASMAGYAASGGYYISAKADRIVAEAGTLTGSIGVTGMDVNMTRLLEKLDIGTGSVSASGSGEFGNSYLPRRDADDEKLRAYIGYIYDRFVDVVADGRKMDRAKVDELGKGQIWLGSEALANGLIDALGDFETAKAEMETLLKGKAVFVDYLPGELNPDMLMSMLGGAIAGAFGIDSGSGPAVKAALSALRSAAELSAMGTGPLYLEPACLAPAR